MCGCLYTIRMLNDKLLLAHARTQEIYLTIRLSSLIYRDAANEEYDNDNDKDDETSRWLYETPNRHYCHRVALMALRLRSERERERDP